MQRDLLAAAQEAMRTMEKLKQARQESERIRSQSTVTQDSDGRNQWPERPPGIEHLEELRQALRKRPLSEQARGGLNFLANWKVHRTSVRSHSGARLTPPVRCCYTLCRVARDALSRILRLQSATAPDRVVRKMDGPGQGS